MSSIQDQVLRADRNGHFKTIGTFALEDERLSWGAKGLHSYLITRPEGWRFCMGDLIQRSKDGESALISRVQELEGAGYLRRERRNAAGGRFVWEWVVSETSTIPRFSRDGKTTDGSSRDGKPGDITSRRKSRKEGSKKKGMGSAQRTREVPLPLPEDWAPTGSHRDKAIELGLDLADEVEGFRCHHGAKGTRMVNWDLAFHTWLRNSVRYGNGRAARRHPMPTIEDDPIATEEVI